MKDISRLIYKRPKKGDVLILTNDCMKYPEDLGFSGIVMEGYPELKLNKKYEILNVDFSDIPTESNIFNKTDLKKVKYAYSRITIKLNKQGKTATMPLEYFKQIETIKK